MIAHRWCSRGMFVPVCVRSQTTASGPAHRKSFRKPMTYQHNRKVLARHWPNVQTQAYRSISSKESQHSNHPPYRNKNKNSLGPGVKSRQLGQRVSQVAKNIAAVSARSIWISRFGWKGTDRGRSSGEMVFTGAKENFCLRGQNSSSDASPWLFRTRDFRARRSLVHGHLFGMMRSLCMHGEGCLRLCIGDFGPVSKNKKGAASTNFMFSCTSRFPYHWNEYLNTDIAEYACTRFTSSLDVSQLHIDVVVPHETSAAQTGNSTRILHTSGTYATLLHATHVQSKPCDGHFASKAHTVQCPPSRNAWHIILVLEGTMTRNNVHLMQPPLELQGALPAYCHSNTVSIPCLCCARLD